MTAQLALDAARLECFWSRVQVGAPDECWPWLSTRHVRGYGVFSVGHQMKWAHRLAYELTRGPITEETIDHLCSNTICCNPTHLDPCSNVENTRRAVERRKSCRNGHPRTAENLYIYRLRKSGREIRRCRTCLEASRDRRRNANSRRLAGAA